MFYSFQTVDVLEDDYCETTISPSLKYKPKVLCIAFNFTHRTSFVSAKSFDPIDIDQENQLKLMKRKHNWYVTGTGMSKSNEKSNKRNPISH